MKIAIVDLGLLGSIGLRLREKGYRVLGAPIFNNNKKYLSDALDEYIQHLVEFKSYLNAGDFTKMHIAMTKANHIKRILKTKNHESRI